jgi:glycine cleavage system regulatory protein
MNTEDKTQIINRINKLLIDNTIKLTNISNLIQTYTDEKNEILANIQYANIMFKDLTGHDWEYNGYDE